MTPTCFLTRELPEYFLKAVEDCIKDKNYEEAIFYLGLVKKLNKGIKAAT